MTNVEALRAGRALTLSTEGEAGARLKGKGMRNRVGKPPPACPEPWLGNYENTVWTEKLLFKSNQEHKDKMRFSSKMEV